MKIQSFLQPITIIALQIGGAMSTLLINIILFRFMDRSEMGMALSYISLVSVLAIFPLFLLDSAVVKFMARYEAQNSPDKTACYLGFLRNLILSTSALMIFLGAALAYFRFQIGQETQAISILIITFSIPLFAWMRFKAIYSNAHGRVISGAFSRAFFRPFLFMLAVVLMFALNAKLNANALLSLYFITLFLAVLFQALIVPKIGKTNKNREILQSERGEWVRTGLALGTNLIVMEFSIELIIFCASRVLQSAQIPELSLALRLVAFSRFSIVAVEQYFRPKLARSIASNSKATTQDILSESFLIRSILGIGSILFINLATPIVVALTGQNLPDISLMVAIFSAEIIVVSLLGLPQFILAQSGFDKIPVIINITTIIALILGITLAGQYGGLLPISVIIALIFTLRHIAFYTQTLRLCHIDTISWPSKKARKAGT